MTHTMPPPINSIINHDVPPLAGFSGLTVAVLIGVVVVCAGLVTGILGVDAVLLGVGVGVTGEGVTDGRLLKAACAAI